MNKLEMNWKNALKLALLLSLFCCLIISLGYTGIITTGVETGKTLTEILQIAASQFTVLSTVFFTLFCFQFWIFNKTWKTIRKICVIMACTLSIVFVSATVILLLLDFLKLKEIELNLFFVLNFSIVVTAMTVLFSYLLHLQGEREKAIAEREKVVVENQKLVIENMRARLETLKGQINPHFLFNSLNALTTLIETDAKKANEFVQQLSLIFRYSIQNRETATLGDELVFTETFCNLMKIRHGEHLVVDYRVDKRYRNYFIIPLSLQMLAENAIKHNKISARDPLTVTIETTDNDSVKVWNTIQRRREDTSGEGVGLANISERYRMLYQKDITISDADGIFSVEIPLIKSIK